MAQNEQAVQIANRVGLQAFDQRRQNGFIESTSPGRAVLKFLLTLATGFCFIWPKN